MTKSIMQEGHCACGKTRFQMHSKPLMRIICHCEICQQFNEAPFADILIFERKAVDLPPAENVEYKTWTTPPMVQRGKCRFCHKPAIETLDMPFAPALTIVPSATVDNKRFLPEPAFHSFYHRRVSDVNDGVPKYSGFVKSQVMFMIKLFQTRLKKVK